MKYLSLGIIAAIVLLVVSVLGGSFYTVDEGDRAVIVSRGRVSEIAHPGAHWKSPFFDDAHTISIRTQALEFENEPIYTSDRQTAKVTFSVNYSAIATDAEITAIYREYQTLEGLESRVLKREIRKSIKNVFGTYSSDTAIRERAKLNDDISKAVADLGNGLIKIEGVNIENISFSEAVENAAEDRARQEMLVQTEKQKLEQEKVAANIKITQAQAEADSALARAKADAESVRLKGEAEAAAIKAKSDALAQSPQLVELTKAERWDGKLPQQFSPGSTIPLLNLK